MTLVRVYRDRPTVSGPNVPAKGIVEFQPSRFVGVTLPGRIRVRLGDPWVVDDVEIYPGVPGYGWADLDPTGVAWAWRAHEAMDGGLTRYFFVPDNPEPGDDWVDYDDLPDVDPDSLALQSPDPPPAWVVAAQDLQDQIDNITIGSFYHLHDQLLPSSEWVVAHNLGALPNVAVIIGDELVDTDVEYVDVDTVRVAFPTPQTGKVVFS